MKLTAHPSFRALPAAGFTLVEMMVAVAITSVLIACVVALGMYTGKTFYMMGNYVVLDAKSLNTTDVLGRQIRDASLSLNSGTNNGNPYLQLTNSTTRQIITITYYPSTTTLTLAQTGQPTQTLLTNCNSWTYSLYNRAPNTNTFTTNIVFYAATNAASCKIVNRLWKCSRKILGSTNNTESVQTAQIVLRNQMSN